MEFCAHKHCARVNKLKGDPITEAELNFLA